LDLKNAFGSVPHHLIWFVLRRLEVLTPFVDVCKWLYSGSTQRIVCSGWTTSELPLRVGIKQGCPLSPLLFNLALEAVLPALREATTGYTLENGSTVAQLAYVDDLCVLASEQHELRTPWTSSENSPAGAVST